VTENSERAAALMEQHEGVAAVSMNGSTIHVTLEKEVMDYSFLPSLLIEAGFKLSLFREEEVNLETAFMELTKGLQQ
jgi:ABC-2 type transport system ATP-binding protein